MFGVIRHHRAGQLQDPLNALVNHAVIAVAAPASGGHIPAPAQTREMARHSPLGYAEAFDELCDGPLPLEEQFKDLQARRIAQTAEEFRLQLKLLDLGRGESFREC